MIYQIGTSEFVENCMWDDGVFPHLGPNCYSDGPFITYRMCDIELTLMEFHLINNQ